MNNNSENNSENNLENNSEINTLNNTTQQSKNQETLIQEEIINGLIQFLDKQNNNLKNQN